MVPSFTSLFILSNAILRLISRLSIFSSTLQLVFSFKVPFLGPFFLFSFDIYFSFFYFSFIFIQLLPCFFFDFFKCYISFFTSNQMANCFFFFSTSFA